jgi:hypothetical protein
LTAGSKALVSITLETDSSFMLRSRAIHIQSTTARLAGQSTLNAYLDQYTGPDGEYLSQGLTRFSNENETFGQYGSPLPVRPPMIYPPGGTIQLNIQNDGLTDFAGLEIYFRGSKLFAPGVLPCLTYPDKFSTNWYIYNGPRPNSPTLTMSQKSKLPDNILQIQGDSDFVLRALSIGSMAPVNDATQTYRQVWITLRDGDGRAYSNLPVHVDVCYGALGSLAFGGGSGAAISKDVGPYHPPLFTPEIYIPANRFLFYDLVRDDTFAGGPAGNVNMQLAFQGAKVYPL